MKIEIYENAGHEWGWRGIDGNNRIIATGAEGYVTRAGVERALENVMTEFRSDISVVTRHTPRGAPAEPPPPMVELATYAAEGEKK